MSLLFQVIEAARNELQCLRDGKKCDVEPLRVLSRELDRTGGRMQTLSAKRFVDACLAVGIPENGVLQTVADLMATLDAAGPLPCIAQERITSAILLLDAWYDIQYAHA